MSLTSEKIQVILDGCKKLNTRDADEISEFIENCFYFEGGTLLALLEEILSLRQEADAIEMQQQTITDLYNALDNVLSHTSTDTIAEAVAVLERVRGETK